MDGGSGNIALILLVTTLSKILSNSKRTCRMRTYKIRFLTEKNGEENISLWRPIKEVGRRSGGIKV